jgi:uncharacterized protein YceH (UPF0502 family)
VSNLAVLQEGEKTMTVRELAQVAGCGEKTVRDKVKAMFPEKVRNGKKTCLSEKEAFRVMAGIRKKGFVQPRKNYEVGESSLTAKKTAKKTTKKQTAGKRPSAKRRLFIKILEENPGMSFKEAALNA